MDGFGKLARLVEIRMRCFPPQHVCVTRKRQSALDAMRQAGTGLEPVKAFRGALAGDEFAIAFVDIRGNQPRAFGIRARDDKNRYAANVGRKSCGDQIALVRGGRDKHLAAQMAALLFRGELILEVNAGGTRFDIRLHDLESIERPAESGFGVGNDRREPSRCCRLGMLDLIGACQRTIDSPAQFGAGVCRVKTLIGIGCARGIAVRRNLPARKVNRVEPRPHHLHRLIAGHGPERRHIGLGLQEVP